MSGTSEPGKVETTKKASDKQNGGARRAPDVPAAGTADTSGNDAVDPVGGTGGAKRRPRGGFQVIYRIWGAPRTGRGMMSDH